MTRGSFFLQFYLWPSLTCKIFQEYSRIFQKLHHKLAVARGQNIQWNIPRIFCRLDRTLVNHTTARHTTAQIFLCTFANFLPLINGIFVILPSWRGGGVDQLKTCNQVPKFAHLQETLRKWFTRAPLRAMSWKSKPSVTCIAYQTPGWHFQNYNNKKN